MEKTPAGVFLGKGETAQFLSLPLANRHGLVAGATGTGKTVTLQILAEGLSSQGVPVFLADVKGDLAGISQAGSEHPKLLQRAHSVGLEEYQFRGFPCCYWDVFGQQGHPVRTTISDMGPLLLSRLLDLNETQEGVVNVIFKLADDRGMLLLDLKDFRAMLNFAAEQASELSTLYGNISKASVGAIQRRLLVLEQEGGGGFFGEPALDLFDLMRTDHRGCGQVNILAADQLIQRPRTYATFLLWLLAELFEELPEVGDQPRPRLVFFFDEAHLLFNHAPRALVEKVEQVVRLIRSKGVGIYFVTQLPTDIPDAVLGQLGNRIQHALRAFTVRDQRALRATAETFRPNPKLDTIQVISELSVGEALVSTLEGKGTPSVVQRTLIRPPESRIGPISEAEREAILKTSPLHGRYEKAVDRESAYEKLQARAEQAERDRAQQSTDRSYRGEMPNPPGGGARRSNRQGIIETMAKSVARSVGSSLGRQLLRGVLGSLFKGR